jgi:Kef-type K+ transport system membrane component KefB
MAGTAARSHAGAGYRLIQLAALCVVLGLGVVASRATTSVGTQFGVIAGLGFLLILGILLSELLEVTGLPHLSGYLAAGVISGPYVLHVLDHDTVDQLSPVNTLALALIALAGGAELQLSMLKEVGRSVAVSLGIHSVIGFVVMGGSFFLLSRYVPFLAGWPTYAVLGVAMLWGVLAVSRSPSACLGVLSQTKAAGKLTTFSLASVMASDVVVVVMMAVAMLVARPMIEGTSGIQLGQLERLGHELLGSVSIGTTLGLLLALYLKVVGHSLVLVLLLLGFGVTEFMRYVHIDPLLSLLTAGFVVRNLTHQGDRLLHAVERTSGVVFVVFFATAGAHLNLPLLAKLWPIALALCAIRGVITVGSAWGASQLTKDPPLLRRWGWSGLISQAGLTLGLCVVVARTFPSWGGEFQSLVIASVAINEIIGPVLFKLALDKAGESGQHATASIPPPGVGSHPHV